MFADISFPISSYQIFSYKIPIKIKNKLKIGMRVKAPLGSRVVQGIVVDIKPKIDFKGQLRSIKSLVDDKPVLNKDLCRLIKWLSGYYNTPIGVAAKAVLPESFSTKYKLKTQLYVQAINKNKISLNRAKAQILIYNYLKSKKSMVPVQSLAELCSSPTNVCRKLFEKGYVKLIEKEIVPDLDGIMLKSIDKKIKYTNYQKSAINNVCSSIDKNKFSPFLLHGITGSGKTEIYIEAARHAISQNKTVLILLPEIALTPQIAGRFKAIFKDSVALWHSRLTKSARLWTWKKICSQEYKIVIGARSAIFSPLNNVGLIIVDEEQENSYKQDSPEPRYHARDVALMRGKINNSTVLLCSATPSLESYYNYITKKFNYLYLPERVAGAAYPKIHIVDMINESKENENYGELFSKLLIKKIEKRLLKNEQTILLHNRRGFSPIIKCYDCGEIYLCPHCKIALTYHKYGSFLQCHFCNYINESIPKKCNKCSSYNIELSGTGTQKVEDLLIEKFSNANIARLDTDVAKSRKSVTDTLQNFSKGEIDILLGTQMIAKGLDFENVTLVGIINADTGLYLPDFRSSEKVFQLIYQAAGRSGRGKIAGEVVVQSYNIDNPVIQAAANLELEEYYKIILEERKSLDYPPYSWMVRLEIRGRNRKQLESSMKIFNDGFKNIPRGIQKLGPSFCYREKLKDQYRMQIVLKSKKKSDPTGMRLHKFYKAHLKNKQNRFLNNKTRLIVDVIPVSLL